VGLLTVGVPTALADTPVDFLAPRDHAFPGLPAAVAIADFNGDSRPDLAVVDYSTDSVAVIVTGAGGAFSSITVGSQPRDLAIADFNGDSRPDITTANQGSSDVAVLLGNGDATFQPPRSFFVGNEPESVTVADVNADGQSDVVVLHETAASTGKTVSVLLGKGDGTLQAAIPTGQEVSWSFSLGDFNNDAKLDIVTGVFPDMVAVLPGNGDGSFQPPLYTPSQLLNAVAAGDFNGDGNLDAAVTFNTNQLHVLLGNGDGTFGAARLIEVLDGSPLLQAADFNGDSRPDLSAAVPGEIRVLIALGDGQFQPPIGVIVAGGVHSSLAIDDLNGDARLDMAVVSADEYLGYPNARGGALAIRFGRGDGTFYATPGFRTGDSTGVQTADFNGDGAVDLAATMSRLIVAVLGNGDGSFRPAPFVITLASRADALAIGDFDGDARSDLIAGGREMPDLLLFPGHGDGTFGPARTVSAGLAATNFKVGDFNHDSRLDLIAAGDSNVMSFLLGRGDGTFENPLTLLEQVVATAIAVADFNGDSHLDIAAGVHSTSSPEKISVIPGNGNGTFQPPVTTIVPFVARLLTVADFNGDASLDVAALGKTPGLFGGLSTNVLLGAGDGRFSPRAVWRTPTSPQSVTVADFDGDQRTDLGVLGNGQTLWILRGAGDGSFAVQSTGFSMLPMASLTDQIMTADFNSDGRPDLVMGGDGRFDAHGTTAIGIAILINISPRMQQEHED
jgi:hypothetical protein